MPLSFLANAESEYKMTITYEYGDNLYINLTNRCSNSCDFCIRTQADGYYTDDLWLDVEPDSSVVLAEIKERDMSKYSSIVFCGYGEPTERLVTMLEVARRIRELYPDLPIRLNTNGQSDLINGSHTAPLFEGLFDTVSISLNASTPAAYQAVCHSVYGEEAFDCILSFASEVKEYVPSVVFSVVRGSVDDSEIYGCEEISKRLGIPLRIREYIKNN
jgi:TatD family-associated radical SAM protein